jgi:hypothetical protein
MKFTEEKLEKAFAGLLGQEGFPYYLGITISRKRINEQLKKRLYYEI